MEIGHPENGDVWGYAIGGAITAALTAGTPWVAGPDSTRIYLGGGVPPNENAWTFGNNIIIGTATLTALGLRPSSIRSFADIHLDPRLNALVAHEYTHVLQYRYYGGGFFSRYFAQAYKVLRETGSLSQTGGPLNALEAPAYGIQSIYGFDPTLAGPWYLWP
jgi:hypothetical protein